MSYSNVIKSSAALEISPLFARVERSNNAAATDCDIPEQRDADPLIAKIAELEAEIASHESVLKLAYDDGFAAGHDAGEADFIDARADALRLLSTGVDAANARLHVSLERLESFALQAAAQALEMLIGDRDAFRQVVGQAVVRQVDSLGKAAIISVVVSRSDFPDSRELLQVSPQLAGIEAKISLSDDLPAGRCDIKLMIGTAEIDINRTWSEISKILARGQGEASDVAP